MTNFKTFKNLGKVISHNYDQIVTNFKHSTWDFQCYLTLDTCHMLHLAQNALRDLKNIISLERE